jgi:hypothetical protein
MEVELPLAAAYSLATYYVIMPAELSSNLSKFDGTRNTVFLVGLLNHAFMLYYDKKTFYLYDPNGTVNSAEYSEIFVPAIKEFISVFKKKLIGFKGEFKWKRTGRKEGIQIFEDKYRKVKEPSPGYCFFFVSLLAELLAENPHLSIQTIETSLMNMHKKGVIDLTKLIREYFMYVILTIYKVMTFAMQVGAGRMYPLDFYSTFVIQCVLWPDKCEYSKKQRDIREYYKDPVRWLNMNGIIDASINNFYDFQHIIVITLPYMKKYLMVPVRKFITLIKILDDLKNIGRVREKRFIFDDWKDMIKKEEGKVFYL